MTFKIEVNKASADPLPAQQTSEKPSGRELALEYYKIARIEIIERMRMREAILFAYLTAVSALLTVVFSFRAPAELLLLVPLLGFGAASMIAQHHEMIGIWSKYQIKELSAVLPTPLMWECCDALKEYGESSLARLVWAQLALTAGPAIASLIIALLLMPWNSTCSQIKTISGATRATGESLLIISDAAAIVFIFYLLLKAYFLRREIYKYSARPSK